jgi:hypothetical protein
VTGASPNAAGLRREREKRRQHLRRAFEHRDAQPISFNSTATPWPLSMKAGHEQPTRCENSPSLTD